ncbi:Putative phytanoyl-CoA dioxygenase [Septoria linicola]|uniref:Phytanoyl-CoA dioxygenase n=1 Tax=Septoria linicola TaxID=215465 RepID=A0A9Q9AT47_9PEZI|nr:putative phytanoyl-CoA dioxygenase [Septoria linicola]USW51658.1 Putative phytanoyl-CoA dioxygenase [Septoria linicola]
MAAAPNRTQSVAAAVVATVALLGAASMLDIPSWGRQKIKSRKVTARTHAEKDAPSLVAFKTLVEQATLKEPYPLAKDIQKNIPIYDCSTFDISDAEQIGRLQDELYHILASGPGVYVLKNFFTNLSTIDAANEAYETIIAREAEAAGTKGDHFAARGLSSRIWNSFSKSCLQNPENFVDYFSNPWFKVVCDSYLGPGYRITSQVNIVKPGGKAQVSHRDYHLGFLTTGNVAQFPKAMHNASALLTLQGAVAHTDMPLDSGPTRFLPFSQAYEEGFMAYRRPEFNEYFLQKWVSLPLSKGDAVFFSPALFHAAGENQTKDFNRSANLIQVSSAFGKPMETIDPLPLVEATFDELKTKYNVEGYSAEVDAFIRAVCEGYPFPTNLDRRPPAPGGMAPESEQDILRRAVTEGWSKDIVVEAIAKMRDDSKDHGADL